MEYHLKTPIPEAEIRKLKAGDVIYVTGTVITARDEAHRKALELHEKGEKLPVDFKRHRRLPLWPNHEEEGKGLGGRRRRPHDEHAHGDISRTSSSRRSTHLSS